MKPILILMMTFSAFVVECQNLVHNPSFENVTSNYICDINVSSNSQQQRYEYYDPVPYWTCPERAFPGPFCQRTATSDVLCNNYFPGVTAYTGDKYGRCLKHEYLVGSLNTTLNNGSIYVVEFHARSIGDVNGAGIRFLDERPEQCGADPLNGYTVADARILDLAGGTQGWRHFSDYYQPNGTKDRFALGTFGSSSESQIEWDNIRVTPVCVQERLIENVAYYNEQFIYTAADKVIAGTSIDPAQFDGDVIIRSNSKVIFKAGNQVVLDAGFSSEAGAYFETVIEACTNEYPCIFSEPDPQSHQVCGNQTLNIGFPNETGLSYSWSPATNLDDPNISNPNFTPPAGDGSITYTVTIDALCGGFIEQGFPAGIVASVQVPVTIYYSSNPNPTPTVVVNTQNQSQYYFEFDATVANEAELINVRVENLSGGVIYSEDFYTNQVGCCNFVWNTSYLSAVQWENLSTCEDYNVVVSTSNYCFSNVASETMLWDRDNGGALAINLFPNVISVDGAGYDCLAFDVQGADNYEILVYGGQDGVLLYDEIGAVTSNPLCLWHGECTNPLCVLNCVNAGTYNVILKLSNCNSNIDQAQFVSLFYMSPYDCQNYNALAPLAEGGEDVYYNELSSTESSSIPVINEEQNSSIKIYPNPAQGGFTVDFPEKAQRTLSLINSIGKECKTWKSSNASISLDIETWAAGNYILRVIEEDGSLSYHRVVVY